MSRKAIFAERLRMACTAEYKKEHGAASLLATDVGVTPQTAAKWLRGDAMPGPDRWGVIAAKVHVPTRWLIGDEHETPEHIAAQPSDASLEMARQAAAIVFPLVRRLQPDASQEQIDELFTHAYEQIKAGNSARSISGEIASRLL